MKKMGFLFLDHGTSVCYESSPTRDSRFAMTLKEIRDSLSMTTRRAEIEKGTDSLSTLLHQPSAVVKSPLPFSHFSNFPPTTVELVYEIIPSEVIGALLRHHRQSNGHLVNSSQFGVD